MIKRPPLRYMGSKWPLAKWIISVMPHHHSYLEAFGGGAGVLLQKPRSLIETYNDLDGAVCNFFQVLRERPAELVHQLSLSPWAQGDFRQIHTQTDDPLEAARRFFVASWQGLGGTGTFRYVTKPAGLWRTPASLWDLTHLYAVADRLMGVQIMQQDALSLIPKFDHHGTVIYCDPPYLMTTRTSKLIYRYDFSESHHRELAVVLNNLSQAAAMVSGYAHPMYEELYRGWTRLEATHQVASRRQGKRLEVLWISPRAHQLNPLWEQP